MELEPLGRYAGRPRILPHCQSSRGRPGSIPPCATPRVGFVHHRGCRECVLGYADDLCLLANSIAEMEALLVQVELFYAWTGLELNFDKTMVQGFDY